MGGGWHSRIESLQVLLTFDWDFDFDLDCDNISCYKPLWLILNIIWSVFERVELASSQGFQTVNLWDWKYWILSSGAQLMIVLSIFIHFNFYPAEEWILSKLFEPENMWSEETVHVVNIVEVFSSVTSRLVSKYGNEYLLL